MQRVKQDGWGRRRHKRSRDFCRLLGRDAQKSFRKNSDSPPPSISANPQMFLNKQNILNVAISRARDYLFIVMPDDETEGVRNQHKIAKIEGLVKSGGAFGEYASRTIEEMIWGNANYLEEKHLLNWPSDGECLSQAGALLRSP
jgi:hypothetical protein